MDDSKENQQELRLRLQRQKQIDSQKIAIVYEALT